MEIEGTCPYCGEPVLVAVDEGGGTHQEYVEDCAVCCRPWRVLVTASAGGDAAVMLLRQDE